MIKPSGPKTTSATVTTANERNVRLTAYLFKASFHCFMNSNRLFCSRPSKYRVFTSIGLISLAEILVETGGGNLSRHITADRIDQRLFRHHCLAALEKQIVEKEFGGVGITRCLGDKCNARKRQCVVLGQH